MKRSFWLALLLFSALDARENPFFSSSSKVKVSSNAPDERPQLENFSYTLPDQARVLKEVTLSIQNLDGSIETQHVIVDKGIDWHRPIIISQGKIQSLKSEGAQSSSADFGFIRFAASGKHLSITTADPMIRHFLMSNPNRIAIDFKHTTPFETSEKTLNLPPFLSARVENHGKFVRALVSLDGRYQYTLSRSGNTISIVCK